MATNQEKLDRTDARVMGAIPEGPARPGTRILDDKDGAHLVGILESLRELVAFPSSYYVKADERPEVYALDVASGKIRHVSGNEFALVQAAGIKFRVVPASTIDNAPKESK